MGNEQSKKDGKIPSVYKGINFDSGNQQRENPQNVNSNNNYYNQPNNSQNMGPSPNIIDNNQNYQQNYSNTQFNQNQQNMTNLNNANYNSTNYNNHQQQPQNYPVQQNQIGLQQSTINTNNQNFQQNQTGLQQSNINTNIQQGGMNSQPLNQSGINMNMSYNQQQQPNIQDPKTHLLYFLNYSFSLFTEANDLLKHFSFYEALFKYEEALKTITGVYNQIDDEQIKLKTDQFIKTINTQIDFTNFQIKNQFGYKKKAGFASKEDTKPQDFIESIRKVQYDINAPEVKQKQIKITENVAETKNVKQNNSNNENNTDAGAKKDDSTSIVTNDLRGRILSEIVDNKPNIRFTDVIGLTAVKQILKEIIILPNLRPDLFTGLRSPPKGLLLFGPPGVGKTMIAKAVATECNCTFFNISAASLTSKYLGESEKLVRGLFDIAYEKQPSVVFVDEIESILSKRTDNENDATKRLKTEFLVQFDGVGSNQDAKVLIIGATNRPHELDSAVLRRLPKRVYIYPFNKEERIEFLKALMQKNENTINDEEYEQIANLTNNYSNSDLKELCREAAYEPIREISDLSTISDVKTLRPTTYSDFVKAVKKVRGTLNDQMLKELEDWNENNGAIS
jgi:SpoVK/Ycf46/Vps4 family AAA+-type ATPase